MKKLALLLLCVLSAYTCHAMEDESHQKKITIQYKFGKNHAIETISISPEKTIGVLCEQIAELYTGNKDRVINILNSQNIMMESLIESVAKTTLLLEIMPNNIRHTPTKKRLKKS